MNKDQDISKSEEAKAKEAADKAHTDKSAPKDAPAAKEVGNKENAK